KKNNKEIIARDLSTETNFSSFEPRSLEGLRAFAKRVQFPSHGLIVKNKITGFDDIRKGITDIQKLEVIYHQFKKKYGSVFVETDMRAHVNPTRMDFIRKMTFKLVNHIQSVCPVCKSPGFVVTDIIDGLPCQWCGLPTNAILKHIYRCQSCNHFVIKENPHGKIHEDPMYCNYCNP
ncbi:MAG: DUF6671 family protein, partial [Ferruginibacter sp.]